MTKDKKKQTSNNKMEFGWKYAFKIALYILFYNLCYDLVSVCTGKSAGELYVYIFLKILKFWKDYGLQLSFGYIAFGLVIPTIAFRVKIIGEFYIDKESKVFITFMTFYLFISTFASLFYNDIILKEVAFCSFAESYIGRNLMLVLSQIMLVVTFLYICVFRINLSNLFKYKMISPEDFAEVFKKEGVSDETIKKWVGK